MATVEEIVDELRSFEEAGNRIPDEITTDWARKYVRACEETNERLKRCNDALVRGHRTDAIRIAEADPNLLDRVALLDFPELSGWKNTCQVYDLPAPPALLIDVAVDLSEAYVAEQSLSTLLANHRIMALARAPLEERLTVMRRIAELDTGVAYWDEDIRKFEQARLAEIRAQLAEVVKAHDAAVALRLNDEVNKPYWRIQIPQELRRVLYDYAVRFQSEHLIAQLREMLPAMNAAQEAGDHDNFRVLLEEWSSVVTSAKLTLPGELQNQIDPLIAWLADEDARREQAVAFEAACVYLRDSIDRKQSTPSLQRAYQTVVGFEFEIPEDLERQYRQQLTKNALTARRRRMMIYSSIAVGIVVLAITVYLVHQHIHAAQGH